MEVMGVYGKMSIPFVSNLGFNGIGVALLGRKPSGGGRARGVALWRASLPAPRSCSSPPTFPWTLADVLLAVILLLVTATKLVELVVGKRARDLAQGTRLEKGLGA